MGLNDWIQKNIMQPLKLDAINMFPTAEMKANLAFMHQRWPGSSDAEERDHLYREPIIAETEHEKKHIFHSGGAGAFAKPTQYVQVLSVLLNNGKSPITGAQILKPETVDEMFKVCLFFSLSLPISPDQLKHFPITSHSLTIILPPSPEPSPTIPRLCPSRHCSRQSRTNQPSSRTIPARGQPATRMGFVLYDYARARRHGQRSKYRLVGGHCQSFLVCHLHLYLTYLGYPEGYYYLSIYLSVPID